MRKRIRFLGIVLAGVSLALLGTGIVFGVGIVSVIGFVLLLVAIVVGLVSNALDNDKDVDVHSWAYKPEEGLQKPTQDKGQLSVGEYGMHSGSGGNI